MKYTQDEGWAWAVTFAGFVVNLVVTGAGRMSAVLYVALMEVNGLSRKQAITPFTTRSAVKSLFGPVVGILGQHYGVRNVIISGAVTSLLGLVLCFLTQNILWITIYYGFLTGIGSALSISLVQLIVSQYFIRKRSTACGLSLSGSSIGSIIFPIIGTYLLSWFGLQGTFLLMGGILMHVIPSAFVMKEPPWMNSASTNVSNSSGHNKMPNTTTSYFSKASTCTGKVSKTGCDSSQDNCTIISYIYTGDLSHNKYYGSVDNVRNCRDRVFLHGKHSLGTVKNSSLNSHSQENKLERRDYAYLKIVLNVLKNVLRVNLSPSFQLIHLSKTASFFLVSPMTTVILDFALDQGIQRNKVVYIISALSAGELIGRACLGLVTDKDYMSMESFVGTAMILQGICTAVIPTIQSFISMIIAVLLFGLFQGVIIVRYPVLVTEYTKPEDQYIAMGSINVFIGIVAFLIPYFVGYFRDSVGSYDGVFHTIALVISIMGLLWLVIPRIFSLKVNQEKSDILDS